MAVIQIFLKSTGENPEVKTTDRIIGVAWAFNWLKIIQKKFFLFFSKVRSGDFPRPQLPLEWSSHRGCASEKSLEEKILYENHLLFARACIGPSLRFK
jgi:hypothetical protein